jgi:hypothetical protein
MAEAAQAPEDRARGELMQLILGFQVSQAIRVAATLGIADLLSAGPRTGAELAAATGTHPGSLYRLMRALAAAGVFQEDAARGFSLTPVGEQLRSGAAGSCAPLAELMGRPSTWQAWGDLAYAVRTGNTAFNHVHGQGVWEHRAKHPEEEEAFDHAMSARTAQFEQVVLAACDFGRFGHIVDVGGGDGTLLARILVAHPGVRGTLLDRPKTAARAEAAFASLGLTDRVHAVGGNFFVGVPEGGDAYLLKYILHDWGETAAADILRSCRRAMRPGAAIIVLERVIGPPNAAAHGKFMDLHMLVMTGGRERTREQFAVLFREAGFRLTSVTPTSTPVWVIEGVPEPSSMP